MGKEIKIKLSKRAGKKEIEKAMSKVPYELCDRIYRCLWFRRVRIDVKDRMVDEYEDYIMATDAKIVNNIIDCAAEKYVYDGDYDCNQSYWENIDNLIDAEIKSHTPVNTSTESKQEKPYC